MSPQEFVDHVRQRVWIGFMTVNWTEQATDEEKRVVKVICDDVIDDLKTLKIDVQGVPNGKEKK